MTISEDEYQKEKKCYLHNFIYLAIFHFYIHVILELNGVAH